MKKILSTFFIVTITVLASVSAKAQAAHEATIEPETKAKLVLQSRLSSKLSEVGDPVTAVLDEALYVNTQLVIPRGTEFRGRITQVTPARRGQKAATLALAFERVSMPWGDEPVFIEVTGVDDWDKNEKLKADSEGKVSGGHRGNKTAENVYRGGAIGGAGAGVILLSGGGGAAGAGALGGGLLAGLLLTKGGEVYLQPGAIFRVRFVKPFTIPVTQQPGASPKPIQQDETKPPATRNN
ncbi:MAG TPA: hypothetical protein VJZ26_09000 [Blastocatellia bacterium]|nr:hypothetical protein [Blastocatellia bacterium]